MKLGGSMNISIKYLKSISLFYIVLPVIIFILGWLKLCFSIPVFLFCLFFIFQYLKKNKTKEHFYLNKKTILMVLFIGAAWCLISGIGKIFYQSPIWMDHIARNSILKDLILKPWPTTYYNHYHLCYYIGQWLVPASIGKIFFFITQDSNLAFLIGNTILWIWCFIGILLIFFWLIKIFKQTSCKKVIFLLILFILFSGLDIIGNTIINGGIEPIRFLTGFEWWTIYFQYSSFTSLLFWVYNQMLVPLIIFCLFYDQKDYKNRAVFMVLGLLYGPFPMLGILLYFITIDIIESIQKRKFIFFKYLSVQNILSVLLLFPIFLFYYLANAAITNSHLTFMPTSIMPEFWKRYILFIVLEFLCYVLLIFHKGTKNKKSIIILSIFLSIIPFIDNQDFIMRVSIPFLFVLFIHIVDFILDKGKKKKRKIILLILLIISSINPFGEISRNVYYTIKQGHLGSELQEESIFNLGEYTDNYISSNQENIFFDYLAKEAKHDKNKNS